MGMVEGWYCAVGAMATLVFALMSPPSDFLHPPVISYTILLVMSLITMLLSSELSKHPQAINVADKERLVSIVSGAVVLGYGLFRRSGITPVLALVGGLLIRRGFTGRCPAYRRLGFSTAAEESGIPVAEAFQGNQPKHQSLNH